MAACLEANPDFEGTCCDAANPTEVDRLFDALSAHSNRLDILVNNVGVAGPTAAVEDITPSDWDRTIAIDLNAAFYATRRATPFIKKSSGSIINIASNAALFGFPLRSPYVAAKWALIGLTKTWAMEMGPDGVNVNAICPGSVKGDRIDGVIERDAEKRGLPASAIRDVYLRQSSMRVFVDASEIAETVKFLCSPAGHNISGQALAIDGHTEGLSNWID
jgi:NAD(P)-dependent dehydrogenase (short-subunit alcohol dehydrogenase family)